MTNQKEKDKDLYEIKVNVLGGGYLELIYPDNALSIVNVTHISKMTLSKEGDKNEKPMVRIFFLDGSANVVAAFQTRETAGEFYSVVKKAIRDSFSKHTRNPYEKQDEDDD